MLIKYIYVIKERLIDQNDAQNFIGIDTYNISIVCLFFHSFF